MKNKKKRNTQKEAKVKEKARILDLYNAKHYFNDIRYLDRLTCISESTRDWIETKMYELRGRSNYYETNMASALMDMQIEFIHQAPFVFYGQKIYFVDFYIPSLMTVIEVDGNYHNGDIQKEKDKERDSNFRAINIKVLRITNEECKDKDKLKTILKLAIKSK